MENSLAGLRHALRVFRRSRGFTAVAVAALALGIGANTDTPSVINLVLLKPLPFTEPDRIMQVARGYPVSDVGTSVSIPKFNTWKHNDVFECRGSFPVRRNHRHT